MIHSLTQQTFSILVKNKEQRWIKSVSLSLLPCPTLGLLGPFLEREDFVEGDFASL